MEVPEEAVELSGMAKCHLMPRMVVLVEVVRVHWEEGVAVVMVAAAAGVDNFRLKPALHPLDAAAAAEVHTLMPRLLMS